MPEYDAFGREIGEDTLAGLGGDPSTQRRPAPTEPAAGWSEAAARPAERSSESTAQPAAEPVFSASPTDVPVSPPPQQPPSFSIPGQIPVMGRPRRRRGAWG